MSADALDGEGHPLRVRALAVACLGVFLLVLSLSSLNVALPDITTDFEAQLDDLQWIVDTYAITFAGLLLAGGAFGDRIGRRTALVAGFAIFGLANLAGAAAPSVAVLIGARAAAGLGAAVMMPATLSTITEVFNDADRGRAIAVWAGLAGAGGAFGPAFGGWLLEISGWRAVLSTNAALALVGLVGALVWVPKLVGQRTGRLDIGGAALSTAAVACLIYVAIEGTQHPLAADSLVAAAATVVLVYAFIRHERRTEFPLLPLTLFDDRERTAGAGTLLIAAIGFNGVLFVGSLLLQIGWGEGALVAGLLLVPIGVSEILVANNAVSLANRYGNQPMISAGLVLMAVGYIGLGLTPTGNRPIFVAAGLVAGVGNGLTIPLSVDRIVGGVKPAFAGVAASVNEMSIELGASIGIGLLGALQRVLFDRALPDGDPNSLGAITDDVGRTAFRDASRGALFFAAVAVLAALPVARRSGRRLGEQRSPQPPVRDRERVDGERDL